MTALSLAVLGVLLVPLSYWLLLALASVRGPHRVEPGPASTRFTVCVAAHDEEAVIGRTVQTLLRADYPSELFTVQVVADHCSDRTVDEARGAGAVVHERSEGHRTGKGAALSWLLDRIGETDAVVVFDADTVVDPRFLKVMESRLCAGESVVQGRHTISNATEGWLPALISAVFTIDNRFQNQGRVNLGLSAKNMGDSICFRADLLRRAGWSDVLTEDVDLRHRLLLDGFSIAYEPAAVGAGEAPTSLSAANAQRARWIQGSREANLRNRLALLRTATVRRDRALLDAACQATFPSYSTLTVVSVAVFAAQLVASGVFGVEIEPVAWLAWGAALLLLLVYPFLGLALERAPPRAYLAIMTGPLIVASRTWLALRSRLGGGPDGWRRTPRAAEDQAGRRSADASS